MYLKFYFNYVLKRTHQKSLAYYQFVNNQALSFVWKKIANKQPLEQGKKASGNLTMDFPYMTIHTKIALLRAYLHREEVQAEVEDNNEDYTSESDEEDYYPSKKYKTGHVEFLALPK
jgi:hypothetical protein